MAASISKLRTDEEEVLFIHGMLKNLRNSGFIIYENTTPAKVIPLPAACHHDTNSRVETNFDGIKCITCEPKWLRPCGVCTAPNYRCAC